MVVFWDAGCLGIETRSVMRRRGGSLVELDAWFPGRTPRPALARRLRSALRVAGLASGSPLKFRQVGDGRWVESWQKSLKPMPIGRRLLALPEGCEVPARNRRIALCIPFGQAFGTGEHASTRLALRLLESHLHSRDRVIDLGTGTGILALAAVRLGAGRVVAVDSDPVAVEVARDTLRRNRVVGGRIKLMVADAQAACRGLVFDLALVNIGAVVIARILPALARSLAPGGRVILSGILREDEAPLGRGAAETGLEVTARLRSRPWSALLLRRRS